MKIKIQSLIPFAIVLFVLGFSYFGFSCSETANCPLASFFWDNTLTLLKPIRIFSEILLLPAFCLVFVPKEIFKSWLKFAAFALPIAFIFIAITPVSWTGLGPNFFPYYRENAAHDAGIAFTVISLILIGWKLIAARRHQA